MHNQLARQEVFDRNMQRIGAVIDVPHAPSVAQRRRWKTTAPVGAVPSRSSASDDDGARRNWISWRIFLSRGLVGGALAASLLLIAWLSVERQQIVSAETIVAGLAETMTGAVWIEFDAIDLGGVVFDGRLFWGEPDEAGIPREFYSKTAITMRPDNPEWAGHETLIAICQTDETSWRFVRGAGVSGSTQRSDGRYQMRSMPDRLMRDYEHFDMRGAFTVNALFIPETRMGVRRDESRATFEMTDEQRDVIRQTIEWLRSLKTAAQAGHVLDQLEAMAEQATISRVSPAMLELTAHQLRLDAIDEYLYQTDETLVATTDMTTSYIARHDSTGWSTTGIRPSELRDHRAIREARREILGQLAEAGSSLEAVIEVYRRYSDDVTVETADNGDWTVTASDMRIEGRTPPLRHGALPLPELLADSTLIVRYDLREQRVSSAEFRNIGRGSIRIVREPDGLDPRLADPDRWDPLVADQDQP